MKTKTVKTIRSIILFLCLTFISILFISCGSDDEGMEGDEDLLNQNAELVLTLGSENYEADFDGANATILVVTNSQIDWATVTLGGITTTGETISLVVAFQGKQPGSSTLTGSPGEDMNAPEGLSLLILENINGQVEAENYSATNVTVDITSYRGIGGITAEVAGTFSGTVEDDDGNQSSISGSFNTGNVE